MGLGLAVGTYGLSLGAVASAAGLSVAQACATSLLMFTGASQFALVGVLGAGGSPAAGVAGALHLGSRNSLYAVRLANLLRLPPRQRVVAAQLTIDESTAMATAAPPGLERTGFWVTGLTIYVVWNLMTLAGAAGAAHLGDPLRFGLDAVAPAAFLALLAPRLRERESLRVAVVGALLALAAVPFAPTGVPVLLAALAVLPVVLRR
jgi:predicted branched-subunit amino acid permease